MEIVKDQKIFGIKIEVHRHLNKYIKISTRGQDHALTFDPGPHISTI